MCVRLALRQSNQREQGYGAATVWKQRAQRWTVTKLRRNLPRALALTITLFLTLTRALTPTSTLTQTRTRTRTLTRTQAEREEVAMAAAMQRSYGPPKVRVGAL